MNEIKIFENQNVKLEVNMRDETVWLTQEQMADLFCKDRTVITKHIRNVFADGELDEKSNVQKMHFASSDKPVNYYNLDVIISVGYRVKSKNGIAFRKWATQVLKDNLIKGYSINQKRLEYLEKTVQLIDIANRINNDKNDLKEVLNVINKYSKSLDLLDDYDHRRLKKIKGNINNNKITYEECVSIIIKDLRFADESSIFGVEREHGFESIVNDIYQTFGGNDLYRSIEEKGANFLYFLVKNHVFIDGNKRIAATLFIYFLEVNSILYKDNRQVIDNNTLVALTLLIAQSNPKEKDILVDLVMNFLNED